MGILGIEKTHKLYTDVKLQNAISSAYSLMRSTLVHSLADSLAYNYSINNTDLSLFEMGKVYFKNAQKDTGYSESDVLGMVFCGNRISRGWGIEHDIKYTYYDMLNCIDLIFEEFGQQFTLKEISYPFFAKEASCDIVDKHTGNNIGFLGEIDKHRFKNIQNIKLIKDSIFYCELYVDPLQSTNKLLKFESKYPYVTRLYNFLYKKNISAEKIISAIFGSGTLVKEVIIRDIYFDKTIPEGSHAVLFEVKYCSETYTLTSEQIRALETIFLKELNTKFGVTLK
jgi:phenylalanyl-tRNA synthetase beta chain